MSREKLTRLVTILHALAELPWPSAQAAAIGEAFEVARDLLKASEPRRRAETQEERLARLRCELIERFDEYVAEVRTSS